MGKAVTDLNAPNKTQNFYPIGANFNWKMTLLPFKASTAIAEGAAIGIEIVSNDVTGNVTLMGVENAAGADFMGIMAEPIVSGDADYATAGKLKGVRVRQTKEAEAYFTVVGGTFTVADVYKTVQIDSTSLGLDVDTAGKGARITGYISSTRGTCKFDLPTTETA
jgi:hypothetical protein